VTQRPVSVCIITRNEAHNLPRCLDSVSFADDVVVLDCGSTDETVSLARQRGARVYVEEFRGHVRQKQRAVELAAHDWILALDADEELSSPLAEEVQRVLAADGSGPSAYALPRRTFAMGGFVEHGGWWPEWRTRLFDRRQAHWTGRDPHDRVEVREGEVARLSGPLHHYNYRDLRHHLEKVNAYTSTMAEGLADEGRRFRLGDLVFRPAGRFVRMYLLRQGFRDGLRGFALAVIGAFYVFLKYLKLWERERGLQDDASPEPEAINPSPEPEAINPSE